MLGLVAVNPVVSDTQSLHSPNGLLMTQMYCPYSDSFHNCSILTINGSRTELKHLL